MYHIIKTQIKQQKNKENAQMKENKNKIKN